MSVWDGIDRTVAAIEWAQAQKPMTPPEMAALMMVGLRTEPPPEVLLMSPATWSHLRASPRERARRRRMKGIR